VLQETEVAEVSEEVAVVVGISAVAAAVGNFEVDEAAAVEVSLLLVLCLM